MSIAALSKAHALCKSIQKRNDEKNLTKLRFRIEGASRIEESAVVIIDCETPFTGDDCLFIIESADNLKGFVTFQQTGEINVRFS